MIINDINTRPFMGVTIYIRLCSFIQTPAIFNSSTISYNILYIVFT